MTRSSPTREPLSISFHNFYDNPERAQAFFVDALSMRHDVVVCSAGRNVQVSSVFGRSALPEVPGARPLRVWWTGEAEDPVGQIFDLHFGFAPTSILGPRRWSRLPLWVLELDWHAPSSDRAAERLLGARTCSQRSRFCNFIYSNPTAIRAEFFLRLDRRRPVDSLGAVLNNRGRRAEGFDGKMAVLRDSLFTIAFENRIAPGYVTEKILFPLLAGSIPIYWGAPEVLDDFNPEAFVYAPVFEDLDHLVEHVLALAEDSDRRNAMATAPILRGDRIPLEHTPGYVADRIDEALRSRLAEAVPADWSGRSIDPPKPASERTTRRRRWRHRSWGLFGRGTASP